MAWTVACGSAGERVTAMFSATFPPEIQRLAGDFMSDHLFLARPMHPHLLLSFQQVVQIACSLPHSIAHTLTLLVYVLTSKL